MIINGNFKLNSGRQNFIVFEGGNGAGKSTLLRAVEKHLTTSGKKTVITREPGGTILGKELRRILQETPDLQISSMSELYLFAADRYEHVDKVIRPALSNNTWVLSDRYYYSTLAFQGYGRSLALEIIEPLMIQAIDGVKPDLVILVDIEPQQGLNRTKSRNEVVDDRFEKESLEFHTKVREGFLAIARNSAEPFLVLSGEQSPEELLQGALKVIV